MIQRLVVGVEQRKVSWPVVRQPLTADGTDDRGWGVLTNEMKRYEYVISASGGFSYGAPSGYHDDCVIALALANHRRWESENVGRMLRVGGRGIASRSVDRAARSLVG